MKLLLMYSTHEPSTGHIGRLGALGCDVRVATDERSACALAGEAEAVFGHRYLRQILPHAPRLRWVQTTAGGVDALPLHELAGRGVLLSRSTCMAGTIARHAHTSAWAMTRGLPDFSSRQAAARWNPERVWLPFPRRAMVIGRGTIGRAIVARLEADGLAVTVVDRSVTDWRRRLPEMDWVFLALPATPATAGFFDAAAVAEMTPQSLFVLVGRSETLDLDALCAALRAGRIGGACLDLLPPAWQEPSHPVWQVPRLLLTPHVAAHAAERPALLEAEAEGQMVRFLSGEPPANLVKLPAP